MVLAGSEWQSNKDDKQKPDSAAAATAATTVTISPATAQVAVAVAGVPAVSNVITSVTSDQELTARPGSVATVDELSKRQQQRLNKKAHNKMELNKKAEQEQLLLLREKHEMETCEQPTEQNNISNINCNDANDNLENQENNNTTIATETCDSNTNTLQGHLAQHQVQLHMAINSVLNANNATTCSNLFNSSMGALQLPPNNNEAATALLNNSTQDHLSSPGTEAKIVLQCEGKSHKFETRNILLAPGQECKVGRLIAKSKASEGNAIFDCKVLSRNHAVLWYTPDGHFWVKDTKSSNGTFINDNKLGSEPAELHYGDTVKFGVEVIENSRQEVHGCIIARVTLFLPDGREAISIESEQLQLAGPNRISYDEIQRLNAFLQEASQREKMLKAKLSNLQGVLDSTRKNSTKCWESMITEDQLLHKINLLEKKLQMMEKNVPENALRNEIVKLLEDKTTYQLTAKEALRKVYQDRCDAMQMLSKMELAYTTSDNECGILRAQILTSKQTLQDFNLRLEQLQQEYTEYKQETLRQQQEAKEEEEQRMGHLKEQEIEMDQMRQQLEQLQHKIADYDSEQAMQQQQALEQLNEAIGDDDDDENDDDDDVYYNNDDNNDVADDEKEIGEGGDHKNGAVKIGEHQVEQSETFEVLDNRQPETTPSKQKSSKKSKRQQKDEFDSKRKVVRKDTFIKWFKNSDLKGADGGDVLKAIYDNADDSGDDEDKSQSFEASAPPIPAGLKQQEACLAHAASDEFIHKSPQHQCLNGIEEVAIEESHNKLETQQTLMRNDISSADEELSQEHALDMLHEECMSYKQKSATLTSEIHAMEEEMQTLKHELQHLQKQRDPNNADDKATNDLAKSVLMPNADGELSSWQEELTNMNDAQVEREEELIVYKERLEQSEISNLELRNEIEKLRHKQLMTFNHPMLYRRALPVGCVALAAILYFLSSRF